MSKNDAFKNYYPVDKYRHNLTGLENNNIMKGKRNETIEW